MSNTRMGSIGWDQMMGLTQDEIRQRLGLKPVGKVFSSWGISLDDGHFVSESTTEDLTRSTCAAAPTGYRADTNFSADAIFVFTDGRLSGVRAFNPGQTLDLTKPLTADCKIERFKTMIENGNFVYLPAAIVLSPVRLAEISRCSGDWHVFSELRLGEPPPDGLDSWAAKHADLVTVKRTGDDEADLSIRIHCDMRGFSHAHLKDGRVTALKPMGGTVCLWRADHSLLCDQQWYLYTIERSH